LVTDRANDEAAKRLRAEERAVSRAQAGDLAALEPVLLGHAENLFALLLTRAPDRATAEDALRETFTRAIEQIGKFRWQGRSIFFWLRRIALSWLIDHYRRTGRARALCQQIADEIKEEPTPADEALIMAEQERRRRQRIGETLAALPERYQQALRLRLLDDKSREECAAVLGVELGTFDVLYFRAVRAFRRRWRDEPREEEEAA
jgi:RNA polymerase sigma-70 factor (ECF subfamily)